MPGETVPPQSLDQEIFDAHFKGALSPEDFGRAQAIFLEVGNFNERSIAMQLDLAVHVGKLEEVLSAYEKLTGPDGYLHLVPSFMQRAVEVKMFGDVIYGSVIAEGEPMRLLGWRKEFASPKIFDLMGHH